VSQRKRLIKQHCQATTPDGTKNRGEAAARASFLHHFLSIILSQNNQSYCQALLCILPIFLSPSNSFNLLPNQSTIIS